MSEVDEFVAQVEAAVRSATSRLGAAGLVVSTVTVVIQTTMTKTKDGVINIKVVELGGETGRESTQTVTVEFKPRVVSLFAGNLDEELINAIETIERTVVEARDSFDLSTALVTLRLGKTKTGRLRVFIGGSVATGQTHEVTLKLSPSTAN